MATEVNSKNIQRVQETLRKFVVFLERNQWVAKVNTVNFFTEKVWDGIIAPHFGAVADEILQLTETEMARLPAGHLPSRKDGGQGVDAVRKFIEECVEHRLENTAVLCKVDDVLNEIERVQKESDTFSASSTTATTVVRPKALMNMKKSHEVEEMSHFIARLADMHQLQKVVDIGSGKGYLGQYLAFQYGLDVIGIDSSDSNTHGARDRNHKLLKNYKGILRHNMNIQQSCSQSKNPKEIFKEMFTKRAHKLNKMQKFVTHMGTVSHTAMEPVHRSDGVMNMHDSDRQSEAVSEVLKSQTSKLENMHLKDIRPPDIQNSVGQSECSSSEPNQKFRNMEPSISCAQTISTEIIDVCHRDGMIEQFEHLQKIDVYSDEERDKETCTSVEQTAPESTLTNDDTNLSNKNSTTTHTGARFCSVTAFVEPNTSLSTVVAEHSEELCQKNEIPFMLIGLHTCGDLAPSMLRLFVHNDMAHVLLNVGCCYHHISEEFETEGWKVPETRPGLCGFPMSKFLRSKGTEVTRPARMAASMAADRIATSQIVPAMGLFYRSVLQVLLRDHYRLPTRSENVGKLAPKCRTFLEYARKALKKLKFDDLKLSDAEISAYSDRFQPNFIQLQAFNQLKVALAPTIEGLFMLDRLCYLQEQASLHRAAVVRLFDPVTSPRCYGILATRC